MLVLKLLLWAEGRASKLGTKRPARAVNGCCCCWRTRLDRKKVLDEPRAATRRIEGDIWGQTVDIRRKIIVFFFLKREDSVQLTFW
jgi:hypothetical protein